MEQETHEQTFFRVDCAWTMLEQTEFNADKLEQFGTWIPASQLPPDEIQGYCRLFVEGDFPYVDPVTQEWKTARTVGFAYYHHDSGYWGDIEDSVIEAVRWMQIPEPSPEIIEATKVRRAEKEVRMAEHARRHREEQKLDAMMRED